MKLLTNEDKSFYFDLLLIKAIIDKESRQQK